MIAHIRKQDGKVQPLCEHCEHVRRLCAQNAQALGLEHLAALIGLLHDMGKADKEFEDYLWACHTGNEKSVKHPHHAAAGAIYAFERWMKSSKSLHENLTAQIIVLCIQGHHAGLTNCLSAGGEIEFEKNLEEEKERQNVPDAQKWFLEHIASAEDMEALFEKARQEVERFCGKMGKGEQRAFERGMLARLMLSILVDADRWDAACFEYGQNPLLPAGGNPSWTEYAKRFEAFRQDKLSSTKGINAVRCAISDQCHAAATGNPGVYTLSVPTGGGKTYSSLRYALEHASKFDKSRIFYIIPYNTILDQNARDIRKALGDEGILEHHSNVIPEDEEDEEKQEEKLADYRRLTERWELPIILTSLVQFLNACYSGKNTDARRFSRLTHAVLIFDEIQSLPRHCKTLFERAIEFLTRCCGATVLLCTATQPQLELDPPAQEIIANVPALYQSLKRVRYLPDAARPRTNEEAAAELARMLSASSVLAIVNTRPAAQDIAQRVAERLQEQGCTIDDGMSDELPQDEHTVLCVHLSTNLCPAHRLKLLDQVKLWNQQGRRVFCASTALIEAGINISFPVVVRSLAGLPSIVQAAGRCNRNMEMDCGDVHVWRLTDETITSLPDVSKGAEITLRILNGLGEHSLDDPQTIRRYFAGEKSYINQGRKKDYPIEKGDYHGKTLYDLLAKNDGCLERLRKAPQWPMALRQSFRAAGNIFEVISENTRTILVPYGKGRELIARLGASNSIQEQTLLLRKAQRYSVNVHPQMWKALEGQDAIVSIGDSGVFALREGYYSLQGGVQKEREMLGFEIY